VVDSTGLFTGSDAYFRDQIIHFAGEFPDVIKNGRHAFSDFHTSFASNDGGVDAFGGLFRGLGATLGQTPDFVRNDGESGSRFSGASCFYRGIQSEDVRLKGDFINVLDDLLDFSTGGPDFFNGRFQGMHILGTRFGSLMSFLCQRVGLFC